MTTLADAIALLDEKMSTRSTAVQDAWRIVRGDLRRSERPSTQMPAVDGEPITARQRFVHVTEDLQKVREEINERGGRGDGG